MIRFRPSVLFVYKVLLLCISVLITINVQAQLNSDITRYTTENGLSHDGVLCITRDRDGFMWFGTFDGINRFDGHNFVVYKSRPGDSSNLSSNKIRSIVEDAAAFLWIKTYDNKIYRFDKKTEKFLAISEGPHKSLFKDLIVEEILPDAEDGVWLLTEGKGVFHVMNEPSGVPAIHHYAKKRPLPFKINGDHVRFLKREGNRIWIGTEAGLNCLQRDKNSRYAVVKFSKAVESVVSGSSFTCAVQNKQFLFFCTENGALLSYNLVTKEFKFKMLHQGTRLNAICASTSGQLYISTTGKGMFIFNPLSDKLSYSGLSANDTYFSLYEDKTGQIWIEPEKSGVIKYNPQTGVYKHFTQKKDIVSTSRDYQVITDTNGTLWTSMKGGGFGYYNPANDEIAYFYDRPGTVDQKFSNIVTSLLVDKTGVLWLSAKDGGINKIVSITDKFNYRRLVSKPQIRSENHVRAMLRDSKGRLWICTKDGKIYIYEGDKPVSLFGNANNIGYVYTLMEDSKGNIWIGTKGNGVYQASPVNPDKSAYALRNYKNEQTDQNSLSSNMVYSIIEDRKGRIWVGTLGGGLNLLTTLNGKSGFRNYANTFRNYPFSWANVIRHLNEDDQGRIWIATSNGLLIFDPNTRQDYQYEYFKYHKVPGDRHSLGNNNVQYIRRDQNGQMWIGTFGGGLNKVIPGKSASDIRFEVYTTENGLSNDVVLSIASDRQHNIWIATERGLSRFNPKNKTFKNYDSYDGLPKGGFSEGTCFTDPSGKLYFGCVDGYISFDPLRIADGKIHAEMALTSIQLYYKDLVPGAENSPLKYAINETRQLVLKHDQNVISIDYAVLDYRSANKINYAYKLEGFDKIWHYVNDQQKATYTNIPPGEYTFKVKATTEGMFNNVPEKTLRIIVKPPFYFTWWAYFLYLVLAAAIAIMARRVIITMIRLRNKVLVEQKLTEVKLAFFTNISHELRTPLTLIVSPLEEISRTESLSPKGTAYLNIVNRNANRMIRFINQLLDFRKIQSGKMQLNIVKVDLSVLTREICSHFNGLAAEKNINFQIKGAEAPVFAWVDEEKIDIIVYNLLSNAFKFTSPHKKIVVVLHRAGEHENIRLEVIDEGSGVPADKLEEIFEVYYEGDSPAESHLKGTGIGLALARDLAVSHQGSLSAQNNSSGGMTFLLELKSGSDHFNPSELKFGDNSGKDDFISMETGNVPPELPVKNIQDLQTPQVLIVEDNPELRTFLATKLEGIYRIKSAADGLEGLNAATDLLPDLILSDVMMPNMNGIQMLDQLKNDIRTSHIPVILLTAKSSIESQIQGLKYGADLYITKPFHTDFLLASVDNLISSRKKLFEQLSSTIDKRVMALEPGEIVITSKDESFLKETIRIVEEGMKDPDFNIEEVAAAIGMGRTTFYKKLKSLAALSPVEFVREMRLKRSKQLLDAGSQTVSEIGYLVGFNSLPYFSTCFKEKYKMSPSEYLKKVKHEFRDVQA